jgi:hypothetical protein
MTKTVLLFLGLLLTNFLVSFSLYLDIHLRLFLSRRMQRKALFLLDENLLPGPYHHFKRGRLQDMGFDRAAIHSLDDCILVFLRKI